MRHRTRTTALIVTAVSVCFAVGTAIGIGLRRTGTDDATTALSDTPATPAPGEVAPGTAADPAAPAAGAEAPGGDGADGQGAAANDDDGQAAGEDPAGGAAGEQAPPEGEERPPGRANQPQIPELELEPGVFQPPNFNVPGNGNGNGNNGGNGNGNGNPAPPPAEEPWPLFIDVARGRIGPGPIWEAGGDGRCGNSDHSGQTWTWMIVYVSQRPVAGPWTVTATARAGNTTVAATVRQEPGQPHRFQISYGFPRGSVRAPANIAINATVTDANGNRARMQQWGGSDGIGHKLFPADYCP